MSMGDGCWCGLSVGVDVALDGSELLPQVELEIN